MVRSKLVAVELMVALMVALTVNGATADHLMPNLEMPGNFDLLTQKVIKVSAKAFSDKNASTLRILDLAVAKTELASVGSVAKQLLMPRGRFPKTDPRKIAQCSTNQRQKRYAKDAQQYFLVFDD